MRIFPSRLPVGAILGCACALVAAPVIYGLWHHFQSPLESFYLGTYIKASVLPSKTLLSNRPIYHRFYVVMVNGAYATPETMPPAVQGVSGKFVEYPPVLFAGWLKAAIYHGQNVGDIIAIPVIAWTMCAVVFVIAGSLYDFRRRQRAREGERLRGSETLTIEQFNKTTKGKEAGFALLVKS